MATKKPEPKSVAQHHHHHHDFGDDLHDLIKALTRLIRSVDRWVRQHLEADKPRGQLVFKTGTPKPKKIIPSP